MTLFCHVVPPPLEFADLIQQRNVCVSGSSGRIFSSTFVQGILQYYKQQPKNTADPKEQEQVATAAHRMSWDVLLV